MWSQSDILSVPSLFYQVTCVTQVTFCYGLASVVVRHAASVVRRPLNLLVKNYWANLNKTWYDIVQVASVGYGDKQL